MTMSGKKNTAKKYENTMKIFCPWCGFDCTGTSKGILQAMGYSTCPKCEKEFECIENFRITYTTKPSAYGTCVKCNAENVSGTDTNLGFYCRLCAWKLTLETWSPCKQELPREQKEECNDKTQRHK